MERTLQLIGRTSNEIYNLRYPRSILNFCDYDLAYFAENAIAVCSLAQKEGDLDFDRVTDLRNSIKDAHIYIEHHLRTVYDKIVLDCWIDYVCRRDNIGTSALWNRFIGCATPFEKAVFSRLCDYRYNKAINEWLNLVRVQDYAKNKISFLFSKNLKGADEAAARRNYFDLMFSVTARELGCRLDELGVTKVFSVGRLPSAPFLFPNISKDIVKNLLADFDYSEDFSDSESYGLLSDQMAMDAFSYMKHGLAQEFDSYNISRSQMENSPSKVYMPCGLKAAVDLEIDALLESGGWLARCKRCGRYYLRDKDYTEDYCSMPNPGGKTCLEIYELEHPRSRVTPELERKCREITDEMYSRVDRTMSLKEYESWKKYLEALKIKVENGEIPVEELSEFISYSSSMDLTRSKPVVDVPRREVAPSRERVVKPFVPERIQRSEISAPKSEPEEIEEPAPRAKDGFFTSPIVQRQKSERPQISHIIRAGEQREETAARNTFEPFGVSEAKEPAERHYEPPRREYRSNPPEPQGTVSDEPIYTPPVKKEEDRLPVIAEQERTSEERPFEQPHFELFGDVSYEKNDDMQTTPPVVQEAPVEEPAPVPKVKVIRKNAAAISAYGKIAGTATTPVTELEQVIRPEPEEYKPTADPDPFKDVGSIFDVLEQSESDMSGFTKVFEPQEESREERPAPVITAPKQVEQPVEEAPIPVPRSAPKRRTRKVEPEPTPEWESTEPQERVTPEKVTKSNAPSGIWTEDRGLFEDTDSDDDGDTAAELVMLKEKKRSKSAKTQRLFDAIMREPEDNPTFRRK